MATAQAIAQKIMEYCKANGMTGDALLEIGSSALHTARALSEEIQGQTIDKATQTVFKMINNDSNASMYNSGTSGLWSASERSRAPLNINLPRGVRRAMICEGTLKEIESQSDSIWFKTFHCGSVVYVGSDVDNCTWKHGVDLCSSKPKE